MRRYTLGKHGEVLAQQYLEQCGYEILHCNWRYGHYGEIDIIAYSKAKHRLSFVEVKTRRSKRYGSPLEAITDAKQRTMRTLAEIYLSTHAIPDANVNISFDLIAIMASDDPSRPANLQHLESAF